MIVGGAPCNLGTRLIPVQFCINIFKGVFLFCYKALALQFSQKNNYQLACLIFRKLFKFSSSKY